MKQFFGWVVLICLTAGAICGLVFGIMFFQTKAKFEESNNPAIIEEYKQQLKNLNLKLNEMENRITIYVETDKKNQETISNMIAEKEQKDIEIESLKTEKTNLEISVAEKQTLINDLNSQISTLQSSLTEKETRISILESEKTNLQSQVEDLQVDSSEKQELITSLNVRITNLQTEIESLKTEKINLQTSVAEKQTLINDLNTQISTLQSSLIEKETRISTLESEKIELQTEIETLQVDSAKKQELITSLNATILSLQNEVTRLTGLIAGYEDIKNGTFEVNFYLQLPAGETLYQTKVVKNGEMVKELETPSETNEYKFDYWTLDKENEIDPLTISITENTNFYGVITQKFHVKFLMSESVVLGEEFVLKGNSLSIEIPTPSKENNVFMGYSVDGLNVTEVKIDNIISDASYIAVFKVKKDLAECSWDEISEISLSGKATQFFNVGDLKTFTTTDNKEIEVAIMGFNHDNLASGGKAGITFGMTGIWDRNQYCWDKNISPVNWSTSTFRKNISNSYLNKLPVELKNNIKTVKKSTSNITTTDTLWLFSKSEISGSGIVEGNQYDYWQLNFNNVETINKYFTNLSLSLIMLRSVYSSSQCHALNREGVISSSTFTGSIGVFFGFCI